MHFNYQNPLDTELDNMIFNLTLSSKHTKESSRCSFSKLQSFKTLQKLDNLAEC